ncbi:hypothetical protein RN001_006084 [Aquatica leii]|uniref:Crossover junction endonuclease EME1 n=1 Tax=Aquatica leii TaxID=1421715 RepID=A0AAN7SS67_9COLE|nr:hypothetical protein RN001_006084 [Aquatica leii]
MDRFRKVSYEDNFSDSSSTIIDDELDINPNVNEALNTVSTAVDVCASSSSLPCSSDNYLLYNFIDKDDEIESILKKYGNSSTKSAPAVQLHVPPTVNDTVELSSDDELPMVRESKNEIYKKYDSGLDLPESTFDYDLKWNDVEPSTVTQTSSKRSKRDAGISKEEKKKEKAAEKAKKQEEAARQKQIKQALLSANRNIKPENCMKLITVTLDNNILSEKYSGEILNALQGLEVKYKFDSQLIPNTVTWTRTTLQHSLHGNELINRSEDSEVDEALLIMNWKEIVNLVNEKTLISHIESIKSVLNKNKLFVLIYELENYFKYHKRRKYKDSGIQNSNKSNNKNDKQYEGVPKIEEIQLERTLIDLQLFQSCCHQFIDSPQVMGEMIGHFTKSVALVPYKLELYQKQQQTDWFVSGDNRDSVAVDKNGNGLKRLWQQQLTTFPLARLEHAEAIVAKYPTLRSLLEECNKTEQREKVLQDLLIRRAAGPLTTLRKIGPELSKKIYTYLTSENGEIPI